ncbi:Glycosyltransferase, GT2 family [Muriicola jejuensis]|uniref:Glycosyltransferase family 2 protein n=1 Tax=Muriicola jejuensis TaxID=504488 RepID=A0A6P0UE37_9FLAO|nr:glycosyltransferase family 2 protein [Muriicola jejuensis]NER11531.1 glycosyltransferase family 2 protein [Muriicola jejuensis]SMP19972.1 Glycosyltransferase, GT2 family [Muriicola jejuensis]
MRVAALYTCFNRREKTIRSLTRLYAALDKTKEDIKLSVFLTDDDSSDGTSRAVSEKFPMVHLLKGNGSLYWAGGMRNSWNEARKGDFDAYLLLNDDTDVYEHLFDSIAETNTFCIANYGTNGIYVGTTLDTASNEISYGGSVFVNRFLATMKRVPFDVKTPQKCELGNANIMWVPKEVVAKIGILSEGYIHGMADYDYTLKALNNNIPILVIPGIQGECVNDHSNPYASFIHLNFRERVRMLYNPVGLDFRSQVHHMKKHFPIRLPIFYLMGWFKVFFPRYYYRKFQKLRERN